MSIDTVASQRILVGSSAVLRVTLADQDGELAAASGTVTVDVTRLDGTTLKSGAAAQASTGQWAGTGRYELATALTAAETGAGLDMLTCQWSDGDDIVATTMAEIVGGFYFSPSELAGANGVSRASDGTTAREMYLQLRQAVEDQIEWSTGVAWVPRTALRRFDPGTRELPLSPKVRTVRSVTIDGVAQSVADYVVDGGWLVHKSGRVFSGSNMGGVAVRFDHGYDRPPERLRRAAIEAARHLLFGERSSNIDPRAISFSNEWGSTTFARTTLDRPFGLPEVDGVISAFSHRSPGMA